MSSDKFTEALLLAANNFISRAKEEMNNLGDVPSRVGQSIDEYWTIVWDSLSQQGRLPVPSLPAAIRPAAPLPPPTPWEKFTSQLSQHKYLVGGVGLAVTAVPAWYIYRRVYPPPEVPSRPLCNGNSRIEAVLVLGADLQTPGFALARDLALRKNFIVLATVTTPADGQQLERETNGWLKALVFNPVDIEAIPAFAQALSSSLSLRFPLRSAGDPYVNMSRTNGRSVLLSAVINALPLSAHFEPCPPIPLEATSLSTFSNTLNGTVTATLGILQAVLPLLRNTTAAVTPSQQGSTPPAVILTLLPATTGNMALPFVGGQSAADAALLNMLDALRREIRSAQLSSKTHSGSVSSRRIKFSTLDVGFFAAHHGQEPTELGVSAEDVHPHLAFYLPAMSRRTLVSRTHGGSRHTDVTRYSPSRRPVPLSSLTDKVTDQILKPSRFNGSSRSSVGAGALTYRLVGQLPAAWLDTYLAAQDYIASFLPAPKLLPFSMIRAEASTRLRKPLPNTPRQTPQNMSNEQNRPSSEERVSSSSDSEAEQGGRPQSEVMASSVASLSSLQSDEGHSSQASEGPPAFGQSEYVQL